MILDLPPSKNFLNIQVPLEHTLDPQPTVYEEISVCIGGLGMPGVCFKGMLEFSWSLLS